MAVCIFCCLACSFSRSTACSAADALLERADPGGVALADALQELVPAFPAVSLQAQAEVLLRLARLGRDLQRGAAEHPQGLAAVQPFAEIRTPGRVALRIPQHGGDPGELGPGLRNGLQVPVSHFRLGGFLPERAGKLRVDVREDRDLALRGQPRLGVRVVDLGDAQAPARTSGRGVGDPGAGEEELGDRRA
jgi:hypothetical protein